MRDGLGGAGRSDDIVNDADVQASNRAAASEGATQITAARGPIETALRRRCPHSRKAVEGDFRIQPTRKDAGDFARLIEAALGKPPAMQRRGNEKVRAPKLMQIKVIGERKCQYSSRGKIAVELETLDQPIHRPGISEGGAGGVECGRFAGASAANGRRQIRERQRAAMAGMIVPGQIAKAVRAEIRAGARAADKTTAIECGCRPRDGTANKLRDGLAVRLLFAGDRLLE